VCAVPTPASLFFTRCCNKRRGDRGPKRTTAVAARCVNENEYMNRFRIALAPIFPQMRARDRDRYSPHFLRVGRVLGGKGLAYHFHNPVFMATGCSERNMLCSTLELAAKDISPLECAQ
jgi:hypothetical protein